MLYKLSFAMLFTGHFMRGTQQTHGLDSHCTVLITKIYAQAACMYLQAAREDL